MTMLTKILALGPIAFGALFAGPIWAAVMDAAGLSMPMGLPTLPTACAIGFAWGCLAVMRGRWL